MPKILYIGFGNEPFMRGGAITYQHSLMRTVSARRWEVTFFLAAPRYTFQNRPRLRTWSRDGIKFVELVDPPYHYDHLYSPSLQCQHPDIERLTKRVLDEERPDIVHIHELQFHTASVIDLIVDKGIPSLKTMHNYYDLCSEGNLMYEGRELCLDYDGGKRCAVCMARKPVFFTGFRQRLGHTLPFRLSDRFYRYRKKIFRGKRSAGQNKVHDGDDVTPYHAKEYRYRRQFFIERLSRLNAIHYSAHCASEIFEEYGMTREKRQIIPLSVKGQERISPKPLRGSHYPVVFGYIGGRNLHKGYQVLTDAFSLLNHDKARLIIWDSEEADAACRNMNIEFRKKYEDAEINQVLHEMDVCLVPSIWEEIFGIIGIECRTARVPVIGSRTGGIPEWLRDGETGFLVTPNNPHELALKMERFVSNPGMISEIQRRIAPWKSFNEHVEEIIDLYKALLQ